MLHTPLGHTYIYQFQYYSMVHVPCKDGFLHIRVECGISAALGMFVSVYHASHTSSPMAFSKYIVIGIIHVAEFRERWPTAHLLLSALFLVSCYNILSAMRDGYPPLPNLVLRIKVTAPYCCA